MAKKIKKIDPAYQALLDMQDDGTTVAVTVGEKESKTNWVATGPEDDYLAYLTSDYDSQYASSDSDDAEYDDLEVEDMFLD